MRPRLGAHFFGISCMNRVLVDHHYKTLHVIGLKALHYVGHYARVQHGLTLTGVTGKVLPHLYRKCSDQLLHYAATLYRYSLIAVESSLCFHLTRTCWSNHALSSKETLGADDGKSSQARHFWPFTSHSSHWSLVSFIFTIRRSGVPRTNWKIWSSVNAPRSANDNPV